MAINKVLVTPDPIPKQYVSSLGLIQSSIIDVSGAQSLTYSWFCSCQQDPDAATHYPKLLAYGSSTSSGNDWNKLIDICARTNSSAPTGSSGAISGATTIGVGSTSNANLTDKFLIGDGTTNFEIVQFSSYNSSGGQSVTLVDPLNGSYANGSNFYNAFSMIGRIGVYSLKRVRFSFIAAQSSSGYKTPINLIVSLGVVDSGIQIL